MAKEFRDLVYVWENVKERVSILAEFERQGDAITHQINELLRRSFITPFDREDIGLLAQSLDDIADYIHLAADSMFIYGIERPTDKAKEFVEIILQVTLETEKAISEISGRIDQDRLFKRCVEINRLENLGDNINRTALAELFLNPSDISQVVRWLEIYKHMESTIDGGEAVAKVLEDIAHKYA